MILSVTFVRGVYQGRGVQHDLAKRGVAVEADVSGLFYGQHGLDKIEVTFAVQGQPVRHDLLLFGSVPSGLSHGSTLDVVYDPQRPSDVMLRSQIHGGTGSIVLASLMVLTILLACLRALWLAVRRPGAYGDVDPVRMSWSVS